MNPSLRMYVSIARPGHWIKHIFIVPGIVVAAILGVSIEHGMLLRLAAGFASACCIASANYVINEWLDSDCDRHHPLKRRRPGAEGILSSRLVILEYLLLAMTGLALAFTVNKLFLGASCAFVLSGIFYNVKPFRTKDLPYADVITESVNNPIRLLLGWWMVSGTTIPPASFMGTYWMGGAFLMSAKRLSEYRFIISESGPAAPGKYRESFKRYTETSLLISCFVYAVLASFLLAVFLIKYRTELILSFPIFTLLFAYYLYMAMQTASAAQRPERLYRDKTLLSISAALILVLLILTFVNIPHIETLFQCRFTEIELP